MNLSIAPSLPPSKAGKIVCDHLLIPNDKIDTTIINNGVVGVQTMNIFLSFIAPWN